MNFRKELQLQNNIVGFLLVNYLIFYLTTTTDYFPDLFRLQQDIKHFYGELKLTSPFMPW
ncbi:MAG: hypothetical protein IPN13_07185 [Bacteroidetes bacterium]|nr:hypothetical protein [Bacteroidota bacterium]